MALGAGFSEAVFKSPPNAPTMVRLFAVAGALSGFVWGGWPSREGLAIFLLVSALSFMGLEALTAKTFGVNPINAAFGMSSIFGVWLRTLAIRFAATALNFRAGIEQLPTNFRTTLFVLDIFQLPELMPNFRDKSSMFSIDGLLDRMREHPNSYSRLSFRFTFFLFFLIPGYAYRLSIKSTTWLYLPIVYIATDTKQFFSIEHLLDRIQSSPWERLRRLLALGTCAAFIITVTAYNFLAIPHILATKVVSPIEYFFLLDFPWKKPWQYFNLISAITTLYLWLESGVVKIDEIYAVNASSRKILDRKYNQLQLLMRIRNLSSILLVLILLVHALILFSPVDGQLPSAIDRILKAIYGEYIPT